MGARSSSPPRHVAALGAPAAVGRVPAASCSPTTRWAVGLSDGAAQLCLPHRGQNERGAISTASLRVRVCAEDSSCGCEVGGGAADVALALCRRGGAALRAALSTAVCPCRFSVNKRIFVVGFGLYGSIHGPTDYQVNIQVCGCSCVCSVASVALDGGSAQQCLQPSAVARMESDGVSCRSSTRTVTRCWGRTTRASAATAPPTPSG